MGKDPVKITSLQHVYSSLRLVQKYIRYYLHGANSKGHGIHSPFVFDFVLHVLNNKSGYFPLSCIHSLRERMKKDMEMLSIEDHGAGSRVANSKSRTVSKLAKTAVKPAKYGEMFYRLVRHYQPQLIVELGTSLGITTSYLASAQPNGQVITIEGSKAIHERASKNFEELSMRNIKALHGNFDHVLPEVLKELPYVDLAYIDGNHRYEPTLHYFHQLLAKVSNHSILVFDDIHWSTEMEQAWHYIKQHKRVTATIDVFFLGFVFFRNEFKSQQHFTIRF